MATLSRGLLWCLLLPVVLAGCGAGAAAFAGPGLDRCDGWMPPGATEVAVSPHCRLNGAHGGNR